MLPEGRIPALMLSLIQGYAQAYLWPNCCKSVQSGNLLVINVAVSGGNFLLKLCWILIPKLGGFPIQW
jgi:hypothetical protein